MIKLFYLLAKIKYVWFLWNLRGFVAFSFFLQCILIIGSSLRVQTSRSWVHRLIWLVYLLADWAAYYAIGLVVPINRLEDQLDTYDIHSFWAPFLLLHIGGPNTIAGFSLEDNELWDRSVLHIVVQAGATILSIYRSLSKKRLLAPTLLVLVAALTRYVGRILALYNGSMDVLRAEIVTSRTPNKNPNREIRIDRNEPNIPIKTIEHVALTIDIKMVECVALAAHSYDLFQKYKGIFCGLSIKTDQEVLDDRDTMLCRNPGQAFKEMEMEISLAYYLFYTKIWTIMEDKTGNILHLVSLASEVGALVLWALANKEGYHKVDIKLTNALLIGGIFLDFISMVKLVFSDLVICHLIKCKSDSTHVSWAMNKVLEAKESAKSFVLFRRWSGSVKQFSLEDYKERHCCRSPRLRKWLESMFRLESGISTIKLTDDMKYEISSVIRHRGLFIEYQRNQEERKRKKGKENIPDVISFEKEKQTSIVIGEYVLKMYDKNEPIANSIQLICKSLGVVDTLIILHTATQSYYSKRIQEEDFQKFNKHLSKYMMYLLFYQPKMMLEASQLNVTVEDMTQHLKGIMDNGIMDKGIMDKGIMDKVDREITIDISSSTQKDEVVLDLQKIEREEKADLDTQMKYLEDIMKNSDHGEDTSMYVIKELAAYIEKKLEKVYRSEDIMKEIWIDFLLYVAIRCGGRLHVQQLGNGGELITIVWLMMTHLRFTIDAPRNP